MIFLRGDLQRIKHMENITTGHWIFAGLFMVGFITYLIWSYRKDANIHKMHYGRGAKILLVLVVIIFVLFIVKQIILRS
jgi:membrane protein YdbS with pleckstrin-like domain